MTDSSKWEKVLRSATAMNYVVIASSIKRVLGKRSELDRADIIDLLMALVETAAAELQDIDATIKRTMVQVDVEGGELICTYETVGKFSQVSFYYSPSQIVLGDDSDEEVIKMLYIGSFDIRDPEYDT